MNRILIVGATSAIAQATAQLFAADGDHLFLVARNSDKLRIVAEDLKVRGAGKVEYRAMDALDYERHLSVIEEANVALEGLDVVLIAHGMLPDQKACERAFEATREALDVNFLSTASLLTHLANYFEDRKRGTIVVIGSVAGDRGRQSNYVYGTAKGAISIFLQGIRNRLYKSGVSVITVKPGFVDTPMTKNFDKGALWTSPGNVASAIKKAVSTHKNIAYIPKFWFPIMLTIKAIPEAIFKRMSL
jgi:hypothetical protein